MDTVKMINRLKSAEVEFAEGMTAQELDLAEDFFRFRFPTEIRTFLSCGMPVGPSFFNFRDRTEANLTRFHTFQRSVKDAFLFDLEHNREDMCKLLANKGRELSNGPSFDVAVIAYLDGSVKLIPFYAHRCFFDGMDDMPIVSFWQPIDSLVYGSDFENYLAHEFLGVECLLDHVPERLRETGIWYEVIDFSMFDPSDES